MGTYGVILEKLEAFMSRYYRRQLLQGLFMFFFIGGLLLLVIGGLEYFLWLRPAGRQVLFILGILLEGYLLARHIAVPLLRLFRLRKGLTYMEGSRIIGEHFPQVQDRLLNLLELAENPQKTELILAGIEQRSEQLKSVPFYQAVNLREPLKYARYALIPIAVALLIWISGQGIEFLNSYQRVVRYDLAFEPPAPFQFELWETDLEALENQPFRLKMKTIGQVQPEEVRLVLNGTPLLMEDRLTHFEYLIRPPLEDAVFYFEANGVRSREYALRVLRVPLVDRFEMELQYPKYLNRPNQRIKGTGNATVPEGTLIEWVLSAINTDTIRYADKDTLLVANRDRNDFLIAKRWFRTQDYAISTSNHDVREYDKLEYRIQVIRDEYPQIEVSMERDSLNPNVVYFGGTVSDDYGLQALEVICHPEDMPNNAQRVSLGRLESNLESFYYTFPSGLQWEGGKRYVVSFRVLDNDGVHGGKETISQAFHISLLDQTALEEERLRYEKGLLDDWEGVQREREESEASWEAFMKRQKERDELGFNDKQELKGMVDRQLKQERLMEKFSKELSESIDKDVNKGPESDLLKERLERQEIEARKNAALMEELQKVMDKIDKEELQERLEELGKSRESNQRSLEQLLELTKRYYVTQKVRELASRLQRLADRQEVLSELDDLKESFQQKEQQTLNEEFTELQNELDLLQKDNSALKRPLTLNRNREKERSAKDDQKEALDLLQKQQGNEESNTAGQNDSKTADQKQKSAARKLKELAQALQEQASQAGNSENAEDAEMLRQILDNLVIFSLQEEELFNGVRQLEEESLLRSGDVVRQQELRKMFEHTDDSLFALSLRRPELSEHVNKQITEVYYNVDKALESLGESQWYRGASYQQYVITASNELASMLADILENMQASLRPGSGQGGGADFQLPDIIQSQEELQQNMQGAKSGNKGKPQPSAQGDQQGDSGEKGKDGNGEHSGEQGKDGKNDQSEDGKNGKSGAEGRKGDLNDGGGGEEMGYEELYEIYKEQQRIRNLLEQQLDDFINESDREMARRIAQEMERFENELLENGITERTEQRLNRIREQMLRLKNAALQQGQSEERESEGNLKEFTNPILTRPESFENQGKDVEILNRQALPLRFIYKSKVKQYFNDDDRVFL